MEDHRSVEVMADFGKSALLSSSAALHYKELHVMNSFFIKPLILHDLFPNSLERTRTISGSISGHGIQI